MMSFLGFDSLDALRTSLTAKLGRDMPNRESTDDFAPEVGRLLLDVNQMAAGHGLKAPSELSLLGKTLLNLDGVARSLSPRLDPSDRGRGNQVLGGRGQGLGRRRLVRDDRLAFRRH